jgi:hypothetical protein
LQRGHGGSAAGAGGPGPAARADDIELTGNWHNDEAKNSVRQVGDQVWWVARSKDGGRS